MPIAMPKPEMETDRLLFMADVLDNTKDGFSLNTWLECDDDKTIHAGDFQDMEPKAVAKKMEACGTRACIAGLAVMLWGDDDDINDIDKGDEGYRSAGQRILGLDYETASQLFLPEGDDDNLARSLECSWADVNAYNAADTLRHLAKTGEVHWFANCRCRQCDPDGDVICDDSSEI